MRNKKILEFLFDMIFSLYNESISLAGSQQQTERLYKNTTNNIIHTLSQIRSDEDVEIDMDKVENLLATTLNPDFIIEDCFGENVVSHIKFKQKEVDGKFRFRFYEHQAMIRGRLRSSILDLIVDSLEKGNLTFKRIEGENYKLQESMSSNVSLFFDIEGDLSKITQTLQDYEKTKPHGLICIDYIDLKRSKI